MRGACSSFAFLCLLVFSNGASGQAFEISQQFKFGQISKEFARTFETSAASLLNTKHCEKSSRTDPRPFSKRYRCGEIPFGEIVDPFWKKVYDIPINMPVTSFSGVDLIVPKINLPVMLSRQFNYSANYVVNSLDTHGNRNFRLSPRLSENLHVRVLPFNDRLYAYGCGHIPGLTIRIPAVKTQVIGRKKIWFITLEAKANVALSMGNVRVDAIRACATAKVDPKLNASDLLQSGMNFSLLQIENPQLIGARITGMEASAEAADWFTSAVFWVARVFFKKNIPEMIVAELTKYKTQYTTATVMNGRWLAQELLRAKGVRITTVDNLADSFKSYLAKNPPGNPIPLINQLDKVCDLLVNTVATEASQKPELRQLCAFITTVDVTPFGMTAEDQRQGCFNHLFQLNLNPTKWWANHCAITSTVTLDIPAVYKPIADLGMCLSRGITSIEQINIGRVMQCRTQAIAAYDFLKRNPIAMADVKRYSKPSVHIRRSSASELRQRANSLGFKL